MPHDHNAVERAVEERSLVYQRSNNMQGTEVPPPRKPTMSTDSDDRTREELYRLLDKVAKKRRKQAMRQLKADLARTTPASTTKETR